MSRGIKTHFHKKITFIKMNHIYLNFYLLVENQGFIYIFL